MSEQIDPELADDRNVFDQEIGKVDLPDYDETQFELPDDFEWSEEGDEDDGSEEQE